MSVFARTLETIIELAPDRLSVFGYAHMPHLFKMQRQIDDATLPPPETRIALLGLAIDMLTSASYVYIGMDHFARPSDELVRAQKNGTLQRNFRAARARIPTSSASACRRSARSATSMRKTRRTCPRSGAALDAGRLPIARGVRLTPTTGCAAT